MAKMLIVVDMENDFLIGSLPVGGALEIVGPMQNYIVKFIAEHRTNRVVFTSCQHPENHCSFVTYGGKYPPHCIYKTHGAQLQIGLGLMVGFYKLQEFFKGMDAAVEEYSGFDNPELIRYVKTHDITDIELCGVARDICVDATAQAGSELGLRVKVLEDLCAAVDPLWNHTRVNRESEK